MPRSKAKGKTPFEQLPWKPILLTEEDLAQVTQHQGFYGFEELDGELYDEFIATDNNGDEHPENHAEAEPEEPVGDEAAEVPVAPIAPEQGQNNKRKVASGSTGVAKKHPSKKQRLKMKALKAAESAAVADEGNAPQDEAHSEGNEPGEQPSEPSDAFVDVADDGEADETAVLLAEAEAPVDLSPDWDNIGISPTLLERLSAIGFTSPTPIQKACIPLALLYRKDIIGAAETGSGKTLAFGIPVISQILESNREPEYLPALVLSPTRELALQITAHLLALAKGTNIRVCNLVGGISRQKQDRLLSYKPHIVVATPGRLWEKIDEGHSYLAQLNKLRFLVIDEADRMVEAGHYEELNYILDKINIKSDSRTHKPRQTFIFSATLTMHPTLFKNPYKDHKLSPIEKLLGKIDLQRKADAIDLTPKDKVAHALRETKISCLSSDKDLYCYYILKNATGRTIVFLNSISSARRLSKLLSYFKLTVFPLHGQMQQRQRLKNLDRFKASEAGTLIATDVAARGLDIPTVKNVIHYHLPKTSQLYIHRCGRTARAAETGLAVALIAPEEVAVWHQLLFKLDRTEVIQNYKVDQPEVGRLREHVSIAQKLEALEHKTMAAKSKQTWQDATAEELDLSLSEAESDDELPKKKDTDAKRIAELRQDLALLLAGKRSISNKPKSRKKKK